jgi:hypothetical protein
MTLSLLIGVVVALLVLCLLYWAVHKIAGAFGLPAQIVVIIDVAIVVIGVLYLVRLLFGADLGGALR